jgi:hypothetical protein
LSGNWQLTLQNGVTSYSQSGFVLQSGKSLNGHLVLTGNCAGVGSAQGEMNASAVSLTVNQSAQTIGLTGSAAGDGSTISGDYSILTAGCGATETGTWSGERIKTLSGSFTGEFTSGVVGVAPFEFSGMLTQGANTGSTFATMAGSMTSSNAVCFADATISGNISGKSVVLNFVASDGLAVGQLTGTASTDATTVTGTYDFFNATKPIPGCPLGDFGSVTLTLQPQP